jgi:recombination endonuclease VII
MADMERIRNRKTEAERTGCRKYYDSHKEYFSLKQKEYRTRPGFSQKKRKYFLWANFKITPEQWNALFISQGSCCAACGSETPGVKKGWQTDHNHQTKQIRGILCHHCNLALGNVKDDTGRLYMLINYLERYRAHIGL